MADGASMQSVKKILESDASRKFVVVSAPGKRFDGDVKVTDLLYACHDDIANGKSFEDNFKKVRKRFDSIVKELKIDLDLQPLLDQTEKRIGEERRADFTASRGEYLCARIMATLLGVKFIDAEEVIFFKANGQLDAERTYGAILRATADGKPAVFPGFYGRDADGKIKTFPRGGSDVSGAIVARAVGATVYENWTDVSGFLACDPRIVDSPKRIKNLSYRELRELSYMGADVLHSDSILPVGNASIPIVIKNTFRPNDEGTTVLPVPENKSCGGAVTGIAGKKNFTVILIEKNKMNAETGFLRKVLTVLERRGVAVAHIPSGIDTLSVVVDGAELGGGKLNEVIEEIRAEVEPSAIEVTEGVALIATVGQGMSSSIGTAARLFKAMAKAQVNAKLIDQCSSGLNLIVGVSNDDCDRCISAIYHEFFD